MAEVQHAKVLDDLLFDPPDSLRAASHCPSLHAYQAMYRRSIDDPAGFWGDLASTLLHWKVPPKPDQFMEFNFDPRQGPVKVGWMAGAVLNVCHNVLDRNVERGLGDKVAFYWLVRDKVTFYWLVGDKVAFYWLVGDKVAFY